MSSSSSSSSSKSFVFGGRQDKVPPSMVIKIVAVCLFVALMGRHIMNVNNKNYSREVLNSGMFTTEGQESSVSAASLSKTEEEEEEGSALRGGSTTTSTTNKDGTTTTTTTTTTVTTTTTTTSNPKITFEELVAKHNGRTTSMATQQHDLIAKIYQKYNLNFKAQGRQMMDAYVKELAAANPSGWVTIVEVGVWLGASTARWLDLAPNVRVIGIDPFQYPHVQHSMLSRIPFSDKQYFGQPDFNKALATYSIDQVATKYPNANQRFALLTGFYPEGGKEVLSHSISDVGNVDVFYIDGGKSTDKDWHISFIRDCIVGMAEAYPDVMISGDDWNHKNYDATYLHREILDQAHKYDRKVYQSGGQTWFMPKTPFSESVAKMGKEVTTA